MRHSVFWKIILGLTIVLTLAETGVLIFLYQYTYDHTIKDSTEDIKFAASSSALALETYDPDDLNDFIGCEDYLNGVCSGLGITYLYVLKPDIETKDELYLARGWGGNASEEYINHRYSGYLAKGVLRDEQIRVMNGEECVVIHEKNEYDDTLICYTPVKKHWSKAKQTTVNEIKSMVCAEISIKSVLANFNQKYLNLAATIVGATIVILILTGIVLYFRVSKPLKRISGRMKNFVSQKGAFFEKLPVKGKDEIAEMSNSFNNMAEDIDRFITDLSELNRQKAELNIAKNIQRGLLEKPDFENENVTINASMVAAKIVGGDLYDYCALDNGNIFVSIADVSDKGVTAALFMARAVTMLHQYAKLSYSPSKILYEYNNSLAKHNPNLMFITTFAAIYNPKTKVLTYSNAGHNVPYIISDTLIKLDDEIGSAAGVFEDEAYPEFEIKLNDGDMLFLYTDGVTDAQNRGQQERAGQQQCNQAKTGTHLFHGNILSGTVRKSVRRVTLMTALCNKDGSRLWFPAIGFYFASMARWASSARSESLRPDIPQSRPARKRWAPSEAGEVVSIGISDTVKGRKPKKDRTAAMA